VLFTHCSLCGGRDYVEFLRKYRVDALLRHPIAPHKPMLREVSPQHDRYSRSSRKARSTVNVGERR
jgi:hypothetical protein